MKLAELSRLGARLAISVFGLREAQNEREARKQT